MSDKRKEPENRDGQAGASQGLTAKKQKGSTPKPPSSTQPSAVQQATEADQEIEEGDETDEDAEADLPSWAFDDEDTDDDDYWPGEEDFVFDIMSEEEIQEKANRLREEIRVALCNGLVWKPSCVKGNSSVNVEAKVDHYQVANWAFEGDATWAAMDYPTEEFDYDFGPIHNVTGSTPLALTGTHVRINLEKGSRSRDDPFQQNMTVTVHASYGTHEARDRLQDTDVCPSDLEGGFSSDDNYSSFSEDGDREEDNRGD